MAYPYFFHNNPDGIFQLSGIFLQNSSIADHYSGSGRKLFIWDTGNLEVGNYIVLLKAGDLVHRDVITHF